MSEEKLPISESLTVINATTLYKTDKWWSAIALLESFGRKQIGLYLWIKKNDKWKRRQKFVVRNKDEWSRIKEIIENLIPNLP